MRKICTIGHFGIGQQLLNGQTIKTNIVTDELCRKFGEDQVLRIDTCGGKKNIWKAPWQVFRAFQSSKNILIFPAQHGLLVYAPLCSFARKIYHQRKLHYVVIGGWLPQLLEQKRWLIRVLKHFDGIYVETNTMKKALKKQGFCNVFVLPNCKRLTVLSEEELIYPAKAPYKLCTFSRVMKEKGIETAVEAVKQVNQKLGYPAYSLDIYGQITEDNKAWFERLKTKFPDYIHYCGSVDADKSVEVLQNYFALLFPTHFYTEGIPGTIIDAYAAGIPVISARWESYTDVVDEGKTGLGYEFDREEHFVEILTACARNPVSITDKKKACLEEAKKYDIENAAKALINRIIGD